MEIPSLLTKNPHRWTLADRRAFREYERNLPADKRDEFAEQQREFRRKWNLPEDGGAKYVSQEDYEHAIGCYCGSAIDELGLSPEGRCLYFHLVRGANGSKERDVKLWIAGKLKRTAKCGVRSIMQWTGLCMGTLVKATKELEDVKLIEVERDSKKQKTNIYTLLPPSYWCNWIVTGEKEKVPF